jgi:hypothetical protein
MTACTLVRCASADVVDVQSNWFKASLDENHHAACSDLLQAAQRMLYTTQPLQVGALGDIAGLSSVDPRAGQRDGQDHFIWLQGLGTFLSEVKHAACGESCGTVSLVLSKQRQPFQLGVVSEAQTIDWPAGASTPPAAAYRLYRSKEHRYFAASIVQESLRLYEPTVTAAWSLACQVRLAPDAKVLPAAAQKAVQSLEAVHEALERMRGRESSCRDPALTSLRAALQARSLMTALHRPWALSTGSSGVQARLREWQYEGAHEHAMFERYQAQLALAKRELAAFYVSHNRWPQFEALQLAERALLSAIESGFEFAAGSRPADELRLRQAILDEEPLAAIESLPVNLERLRSAHHESLLNVAIRRPDVLAYLLRLGLDPNRTTASGKTPLMYAAEHNQLRSAQLLLRAGAWPNAATIVPAERCADALEGSALTALHYAARHASGDVIRLLLAHGAVPFAAAAVVEGRGRYPLNWLLAFTAPGAAEINPNITATESAALESQLLVPEPEQRARIAAELTRRAEADLARGNIAAAHRWLQDALHAQADDVRALSAMSNVGSRAGSVGEALRAGVRLRQVTQDAPLLAQSWLAYAAACEVARPIQQTFYDGTQHCTDNELSHLLQAWQLMPEDATMEKVAQVFDGQASTCNSAGGQWQLVLAQDADRTHLYVRHPNQGIEPGEQQWRSAAGPIAAPRRAGRHDLGAFAVSVFVLEAPGDFPVTIGAHSCARG